jgi:hypothetical protein
MKDALNMAAPRVQAVAPDILLGHAPPFEGGCAFSLSPMEHRRFEKGS